MDLLKEIGTAKRIGIAGHVRPDGDAVSSCLALKAYLDNALKDAEVTVYLEGENLPTIFSYMRGYELIVTDYPEEDPFDVFISLDVSALDRLGKSIKYFENARKTICVDHHESNTGLADVNEIKPFAAATCEVLFGLFEKEYMDNSVAECLYTGMVHDSGVFQYSNMSKESFNVVGELVTYDFDGPAIIQKTFYEKTYVQNQILGRALLESMLLMDGKCIASVIDKKMMQFYDVKPKHFEGIVNQLQNTRGVEVAIFVYEQSNQHYKVSLRSNGKVNVAKVAATFNGGGHDRAAGAEIEGTYRDVINSVTQEIAKQLED